MNSLELKELGFTHTEVKRGIGQPAYDPAIMLKLYLYGYQWRIRSSRQLEHLTRDPLEARWLCQQAAPSYKTIANFRKDNVKALKAAQRGFAGLCRALGLFDGKQVEIDGSYLKADANASKIHTNKQLQRQLRQLDEFNADETEAEELAEVYDLKAKLGYWLERQK